MPRIMNVTLLKILVALVPAGILFVGSVVLRLKERAFGSFLQLVGAGCLVMVVLTHFCKYFLCFHGCIGDRSTASVTTSTSGVPFLVSPCFP